MFGARLTISFMAGAAATLVAGMAQAADYSQPPCYDPALIASGHAPPGAVPCFVPPPVVVEEFSGWYLRGDIGFSNQQVDSLSNPSNTTPFAPVSYGFDAAPIMGLGVGYYFNDWLRFDVTGEYRGRANFHGLEIYSPGGVPSYTDEYQGSKSEWLFLANFYVDLGTWNKLTPFIGAGVGMSRNTIHDFLDTNIPNQGVASAPDASKWNFAWALHAGVAYKVSKNFAVELSYRYLDMGDASTGTITTYDGAFTYQPTTFERLTSHDIRLGLRFNLDAFDSYSQPVHYYSPPPPVYQPAPVYAPPVYTQPPVYMQPPLRSKG